MNRYMTRRYVAVCWAEAIRLTRLEGTPLGSIRCHQNIELLHRTDWWAWWSDERLTTAIGLPEALRPDGLSVGAIALIDEVWMGGAITPQCGWALLARVERIVSCERIWLVRKRDSFRCQDKLTLQLIDGEERVLYRDETLNRGVYHCDIISDLSG